LGHYDDLIRGPIAIETSPLMIAYLVVFGGFACLFPLAFYCLMLASWNSRRRPLIVSGPADFAAVILATSGFLIAGGPLILVGLHDAWRAHLLHGTLAEISHGLGESSGWWLIVWLSYFLIVVCGSAWLLIRRRNVSVVYNIDPTDAEKLLPEAIHRLGVPLLRRGTSYFVEFANDSSPCWTLLDLTVGPALRHLTLHWSGNSGDARRRIEAEIRQVLATTESPENPAAGWLLTAATGLFALLLVLVAMFVFRVWHFGR
jgi:hypothetical protein